MRHGERKNESTHSKSATMKFLKNNKTLIILLLIASIPLFFISNDRKTDWNLSLKPEDKKPFGTFVFDSLMRYRYGARYSNTQKTLYRIQEESAKSKTVIVLADYLNLKKEDLHEIKEGAARGNHYILAANDFDEAVCDSFELKYDRKLTSPFSGKKNKQAPSLLCLVHHDSAFDSLYVEANLYSGIFYPDEAKQEVMVSNHSNAIAVRYRFNQGSVIFCASPYFFTNYFLVHDHYAVVTNHLLSGMQSEEVYFASRYLIPQKKTRLDFQTYLRSYRIKIHLLHPIGAFGRVHAFQLQAQATGDSGH
jgi:hypothetical protein